MKERNRIFFEKTKGLYFIFYFDPNQKGPSFSTPHRDPPAEPSKLMNSIFKHQFDAQKKKELKATTKSSEELEREKAELERLRNEVEKQQASMKLEVDRFKRQNNALEELRKQRERELEITRMERSKAEKDGQKRVQELDKERICHFRI